MSETMGALPALSARELIGVLSDDKIKPAPGLASELDELAAKQEEKNHWLGWYLYWMVAARQQHSVLMKKNMLLSPGCVASFDSHLNCIGVRSYKWLSTADLTKVTISDQPELIQFDAMLRSNRREDAVHLGDRYALSVVSQYVGLPYVRLHLSTETEDILWSHVKLYFA